MEEFVRRLFGDAEFRREFLANPAQTITSSGLNKTESDAALRLSGQLSAAVAAPRPRVLSLDAPAWD